MIYEFSKSLVLKHLPGGILNGLKKRHYLRTVEDISSEPDLKVVQYLVGPDDCVVDLGANIGVYTVFLSRLVKRVYAFEPIPATFEFLENNVKKLQLKNVILERAAITDQPRVIKMSVPKQEGVDNFYQASVTDLGDVVVQGKTLDQAVPERVTFIKCDVEGHEFQCLQGAARILEQKPAWLIEVFENNIENVFPFMRARGYDIWVLRNEELQLWAPGLTSVNYFFLQPEHADRLFQAEKARGLRFHVTQPENA